MSIVAVYIEKIKRWGTSIEGRNIALLLTISGIGVLGFLLGKQEVSAVPAPIQLIGVDETYIVRHPDGTAGKALPASDRPIRYVASTRGTKYYPESCSAGKNLKAENRIYFATMLEAEKAGYTQSSSCSY